MNDKANVAKVVAVVVGLGLLVGGALLKVDLKSMVCSPETAAQGK